MSINQSLRGVGFGPVLAAQRAYVQQHASRSKFGLMVPEAFIRGIRDLGYRSNGDAIAELIDNAIQAFADRIDIVFGYDGTPSAKKPVQLAVVDNGHGMEPDMIRMAVMWGGTHREGDRSGLGRYGYGLPCSSVSLGRRFTVFSKMNDSILHAVTLDLDAIAAGEYTNAKGEIEVPEPQPAALPEWLSDKVARCFPEGWTSGTAVLLEKLDRLEWSTAQGLRENLCRQFGVTYHKLRGEAALLVDGTFVEPIDPLFLTPEFHLFDLDSDRAQRLDPMRVEVRDPETGEYLGAIALRYAWLPPSFGSIDKERDAVGLNANARFSILKDYHGLIFSRNGRLIDVQTRAPWTTFINNDRYIKVEIEFSAKLDEMFGVTTSKQQVTVSPFIWDLLRQAGLPKAIEQLRNKVRQAKFDRRARILAGEAGALRASERAMIGFATRPSTERQGHQWALALETTPYSVEFEHHPGGTFFSFGPDSDRWRLRLNTAHRFFQNLYDAPTTSPAVQAGLELMLFCLGEATRALGADQASTLDDYLERWSERLEEALSQLSSDLGDDDLDVAHDG